MVDCCLHGMALERVKNDQSFDNKKTVGTKLMKCDRLGAVSGVEAFWDTNTPFTR